MKYAPNQVTKWQEPKKRQWNKPRFADDSLMPVIPSGPDRYTRESLEQIAKIRGYKNGIEPYKGFLYDAYWATRDADSRILVSKAGEVAQWFPDQSECGGSYKIMAQEWKQEYSPEQLSLISELKNELSTWRSQEDLISICNDLHQATVQNQKYLWVHLFTDTEFPQSSAAYQLHKLVADLHCQVTEEIVEWYEPGKARIKGRLQTEHLDGIKDNNSIHNLHHTTGTLNTRMIGVPVSEKRWEYENYCPIGRLRDMQDSLKQMEPWGTVN